MSRCIVQERRVRSIAAVHALLGPVLIAGSIRLLMEARRHNGPRDLLAQLQAIVGIAGVIAGVIVAAVAWLLWMYKPFARWTTGALFAFALPLILFMISKREAEEVLLLLRAWSIDLTDPHDRGLVIIVLIQVMVVTWGAIVLVTLFRPDSREIFSAGYRKSIEADRAVRIPILSSPYFLTGLLVWLIIGLVIAWALSW